jgi:hypothetical protein
MRRIAGLAACALALTLPAAADAAPNWVRVPDPAPGGTEEYYDGLPITDLTIAGRTPYLATESLEGELTVWRPNAAGDAWIPAGDAVNHVPLRFVPPFRRSDYFTIGADGDTPWIAWTEQGVDAATDIHVARLVGNDWEEPAQGWPSGDSVDERGGTPRIVLFDGRPYVTIRGTNQPWASDPATAVTRLSTGDTTVEPVTDGLPDGCTPDLTVSSGRLYTVCGSELLRLSDDETAWESVATHSEPFQLVDVTGTLYLLGASGGYRLDAHDQIKDAHVPPRDYWAHVAGFQEHLWTAFSQDLGLMDFAGPVELASVGDGVWTSAPSPSLPEEGASPSKLIEDSDGNLWLLWQAHPRHSPYPPRYVHVARFAEQGEPFDFAPDPVDEPPADDGGEPAADDSGEPDPATDTSGDDGGFTTPDGTPATPPVAQPPLGRGACANALTGTGAADRLVGSLLGDRIRGFGGADHLFGRSGSDCIWGGSGNDYVSGGGSADSLSGGRGSDRIVPGGGRDDVAAGSGADVTNAVGGGVDRINCGPGRDSVKLSPNDLMKGCEHVIVVRR